MQKLSELNNILFVIVIYKRHISQSETFISLQKCICDLFEQKIDIYIYDNSPIPQDINNNNKINFIYKHDPSNPGVSKAYNQACIEAEKMGKQWILIFDQDSTLPLNFIYTYCNAINEVGHDVNVIAPIIYHKNILISPCRYFLHRGFRLYRIKYGKLIIKGHSLINSGLLIKVKSIKEIGYFDERLFDYSDHDLFLRFSKKNKYIKVIDLAIAHELSVLGIGNNVDDIYRFKKLALSSSHMAKKYSTYYPYLWLSYRAIKLFFVTKKIAYIQEVVKILR
ncbi:MAG: glycosyltransferase [Chlorobiaceae bacterium]|nr:glycosyltransferase [Chlorobiaceae bacterium]